MWIDGEFLDQTTDAINATGSIGVKSHFTHPDASGDGLSSFLGRHKDARREGDRVLADLHLAKTSHNTPDGDLAGYVMDRAIEDPTSFGQSISFIHDQEAEDAFHLEHGGVWTRDAWSGVEYVDLTHFESPDPLNTGNLPHARLQQLRAVDVVDDPAANPDGLFHSGKRATAREAEQLLTYALGLSAERPELGQLDIDPDRVAGFVDRFLARNSLRLQKLQDRIQEPEDMEKDTNPAEPATDPTPQPTREDFAAELSKFTTRFGAENGAKWFSENKSWPEALEAHCDALTADLKASTARVAELEQAIETLKAGEPDALDLGDPAPNGEEKQSGLPVRFAHAN